MLDRHTMRETPAVRYIHSAVIIAIQLLTGCATDPLDTVLSELPALALEAPGYPPLSASQIGKATRFATGFSLSESPVWDPCTNQLLVSDANANKIYAIDASGQRSVFMANSNYTNGMCLDRDGALLLAQMGGTGTGRVVRRERSGNLTVLADKGANGARLHTPDDVVARSDGTVYFTDGHFPHGPSISTTLTALPVYSIAPTGRVAVGPSLPGPNGIELSPDEGTLYVNSYFGARLLAYPVASDGSLGRGSTLASSLSKADSMCLDAAGNLYVGVQGGLQVLQSDGARIALIPISGKVTNCTFGGESGRTLYITNWTDVWKVDALPIPGLDWVKNQQIVCG